MNTCSPNRRECLFKVFRSICHRLELKSLCSIGEAEFHLGKSLRTSGKEVLHIVRRSAPFEIVDMVVHLLPIFMIDLMTRWWLSTNPRLCYKTMDTFFLMTVILTKGYNTVAIVNLKGNHMTSLVTNLSSLVTFVVRELWDLLPLTHMVLSLSLALDFPKRRWYYISQGGVETYYHSSWNIHKVWEILEAMVKRRIDGMVGWEGRLHLSRILEPPKIFSRGGVVKKYFKKILDPPPPKHLKRFSQD